ncbi:hypothetical protein L6452_39788 [Arctium lappa]|uniref:Uncharacterized protein n=1 Tax=Arctium lappa TaxID=4217 RepID=A0ACB8XTH1_ARCLA|nr:hypothetical protein L6452_39788 [Arctium lappa]
MYSQSDTVTKGRTGVDLERREGCMEANVDVDESNSDDALGEDCRMLAGSNDTKEVVLAFDSVKCSTVEVPDGVSKTVEVFPVEDCFVDDEVLSISIEKGNLQGS